MNCIEELNISAEVFSFSQVTSKNIPTNWILLDNQSTVDLFCNPHLLKNIRKSERPSMKVQCNAGQRITNLVGDLPGYGTVWYDPNAIANILSLKRVTDKYHVVFDSNIGESFVVTKPDRKTFEFQQSETGLYYLDDDAKAEPDLLLVNTVAAIKSSYTNEACLKAVRARELQIKIGRPSVKAYIKIVISNFLPNGPVTKANILAAAEHIFGPDMGSLKGKTTRRGPHMAKPNIEMLPPQNLSRYRNVTLA